MIIYLLQENVRDQFSYKPFYSTDSRTNRCQMPLQIVMHENILSQQDNIMWDVRFSHYCDSLVGLDLSVDQCGLSESMPHRSLCLCCAWQLSAINQAAVDTTQGQSPSCQYKTWFSTSSRSSHTSMSLSEVFIQLQCYTCTLLKIENRGFGWNLKQQQHSVISFRVLECGLGYRDSEQSAPCTDAE